MPLFTSLRTVWLRYIIRISHDIYSWRENLKTTVSVRYSLWLMSCIIVGELWLFVIGLPLFFFIGSPKRMVGLEDEGLETIFRFRLYHFFGWITLGIVVCGGCVLVGSYYAQKTRTLSVAPYITYTWSLRDESVENLFLYDPAVLTVANGSAVLKNTSQTTSASTQCEAVFEARQPFSFLAQDRLIGWTAVATAGTSTVGFQLSPDKGVTWYGWAEGGWRKISLANASRYSSVAEVHRHIETLPRGSGGKLELVFRARLNGKCSDNVGLSSVSVSAVRPVASSFTQSALVPLVTTDAMLPVSTAAAVPSAVWSFRRSVTIPAPEELTLQALDTKRQLLVRGQTRANAEVVVFFDDARLTYRTRADENGGWRITHEQDFFSLSDSEHMVYAIARDPLAPFVSIPSKPLRFVVRDQAVPFSFFATGSRTTFFVLGFLALLSALLVYRERT